MPTAPPIEEEEDQPVVPAQPKPRIGTTGGVIPDQASDVAARQEVQWDSDPAKRQEQVDTEIKKRRLANFQEAHPFQPDSFAPQGTTTNGRDERAFAADAEDQFNYQQRTQREAAIESRRQQSERLKDANVEAEDRYRSNGQQFYTDARGVIKPVIEAGTNKALYHATDWEASTHPKTGKPVLMKRDRYGQRQFKDAPVVASLDPTDNQLYTKMPDGSTVPAGTIDEMAAHPNYNIAKVALAAKSRQVKAIHQQTLAPMKEEADQAFAQLEDAKTQMGDLDKQIEGLTRRQQDALGADGSDTPLSQGLSASLQQLEAQRAKLDGQTKAKGELAVRVQRTRNSYAVAHATAMRDSYAAQQNEIAARLRAQGKKPESDSIYQANLQGLQSAERILQQAPREESDTEPRAVAAQAAPDGRAQGNNFETKLAPNQEQNFQQWKRQNAPNDSGVDYDLRGAFKAGLKPDANGHWPDTFKKPNHPTFSNQSIYAGAAPEKAGSWNGDSFTPAAVGDLDQAEPYAAAQRGVKNIGGVGIKEFARRYGDGQGPVQPASLIKLMQRSKALEQMLSNDKTAINQTMRASSEAEKTYIDQLASQRFAKLSEDDQKKVTEVTRDPTFWDKIKGGVKSGAEAAASGGGSVLKGIAVGGAKIDTKLGLEDTSMGGTTRDRAQNSSLYKLGSFIQEASRDFYSKNAHEDEGGVSKALNAAAEAVGGFAPLIASGAAAPATIGLQSAGEEMDRIYAEQIKKGVPPETASNSAVNRALASGAIQSALFEVLPKPLQKAGNKLIVDKIAGGALKKFLAERVAQGVEGAVLGGTTTAAGNVAAGRDAKEGVAEGAEGLGIMQAMMPRAGQPRTGTPPAPEAPRGTPPPKPTTLPGGGKIEATVDGKRLNQNGVDALTTSGLKSVEPTEAPKTLSPEHKAITENLHRLAEASVEGTPEQRAAANAELERMVAEHQSAEPPPPVNAGDAAIEKINKGIRERAEIPDIIELNSMADPASFEVGGQISVAPDISGNIVAKDADGLVVELDSGKRVKVVARTKIPVVRVDEAGAPSASQNENHTTSPVDAAKSETAVAESSAAGNVSTPPDNPKAKISPNNAGTGATTDRGAVNDAKAENAAKGAEDVPRDVTKDRPVKPPPDRPTSDSAHAMSGEQFGEFYRKRNKEGLEGTGLTDDALAVGRKTKSPEDIKKLGERKNEAAAASQKAMEAGDYQGAIDLGMKAQFFSEAHQAATGGKFATDEIPRRSPNNLTEGDNFDREWREQGGRGGSENQVIFRDGKVYKRNYSAKLGKAVPNYGSIEAFNEHVKLHNELFPSAKITREGMSETSDGPAPVISQDEIKGTNASLKEIRDYMEARGFKAKTLDRYVHEGKGIEVSDLRDGNVLKDAKGELHVIDPVVKRIKAHAATDEPARTAKPAETQLGDQPVKVELRRGKTGDLIEVEMPAKMAEKRIRDHVEILDKVLACLKGTA